MGYFYSLRDWFELNQEQFEQAKEIIFSNIDKNPYNESWVFPRRGGYSRFIFFGHTVRDVALDSLRGQIRRIATAVMTKDGEFEDYVEGLFHIDAEDGRFHYVWRCKDGEFIEGSQ